MSRPDPNASFLAKVQVSLADDSFVRLGLSWPAKADAPEKISGRLIRIRGIAYLSLTSQKGTRSDTFNLTLDEAPAWLQRQLGDTFRTAVLHTTRSDWQLHFPAGKSPRLIRHKPVQRVAPERTHDLNSHTVLDDSATDWLCGLGVTDARGRVKISMTDKYRQINRYLEILTHLSRDCGWEASGPAGINAEADNLNTPVTPLTFADMGCGKGYLTFGAWHLFRRVRRLNVRVLGVEIRENLVASGNALTRRVRADGLSFRAGDIGSVDLPRMDALIALHACNTATDEAILRGISCGSKLLVVAPCCHKEARAQLTRPEPFAGVLRHGIMAERLAEWLTDGLRALFLEWAGYRTKVFEFVASEHTPKNLMIAAVRQGTPFSNPALRDQIVELKNRFGLQRLALDPLLSPAEAAKACDTSRSG